MPAGMPFMGAPLAGAPRPMAAAQVPPQVLHAALIAQAQALAARAAVAQGLSPAAAASAAAAAAQNVAASLAGMKRQAPEGGLGPQPQRYPPNIPQRDGAADGAADEDRPSTSSAAAEPQRPAKRRQPKAAAGAVGSDNVAGPSGADAAGGSAPQVDQGPEGPDGGRVTLELTIPQRDGPGDDSADGADGEDGEGGEEAVGDEILSDDSEQDEDEAEFDHYLFCQFEKVARTKNRWKVTLKDGVFHVNRKVGTSGCPGRLGPARLIGPRGRRKGKGDSAHRPAASGPIWGARGQWGGLQS
jgi:transcription initiation factor TFIIA large subunit